MKNCTSWPLCLMILSNFIVLFSLHKVNSYILYNLNLLWHIVFSFVLGYFQNSLLIFSLIQWFWLLKSVLFSLYIFVKFPIFLLLLISSFITLWSKKILVMISISFNLLRLVFQHNIWSILGNVSWGLEKNLYTSAVGWKVLYVSVRSI